MEKRSYWGITFLVMLLVLEVLIYKRQTTDRHQETISICSSPPD